MAVAGNTLEFVLKFLVDKSSEKAAQASVQRLTRTGNGSAAGVASAAASGSWLKDDPRVGLPG